MKFSQLAELLSEYVIDINICSDFEITAVTSNSLKIVENSLFCAIKGVNIDGNDYVDSAFENGAGGVISTEKYDGRNFIQITDDRMAYSEAVRFFYGETDKKLNLIGVTGTNGKTTSVYLFFELLRNLNKKVAVFTTIENFDGREFNESNCTTPDAGILFEFCSRAKENGVEFFALECSSHALVQRRLGKSKFQTAVFANLTGDHCDFHGSMENYFAAKKILFTENLAENGTAVINIDDKYGAELAKELRLKNIKTLTFGFAENADMKMQIIEDEFVLNGKIIKSSLFGKHNFYNITGVLSALVSLGFDFQQMCEILKCKDIRVPGRLEKIELGKHGTAFVDYAHTDDALRNVLGILKKETERRKSRLICVFGCGGNRDKSKRPRMGKVVSELADKFIVTSDNPRNEEPYDIIKEILAGCTVNPYAVCIDRREAIWQAVKLAEPNDIILVAGKGHEKEQQIGEKKFYFNDCEELIRAAEKC